MFEMILLGAFLLMAITAAIAFRHGYDIGCDHGWNEGYEFASRDSEITWRITATGEQAPDTSKREPLSELHLARPHKSINPTFLNS